MTGKFWCIHTLEGGNPIIKSSAMANPQGIFKYVTSFPQMINEEMRSDILCGLVISQSSHPCKKDKKDKTDDKYLSCHWLQIVGWVKRSVPTAMLEITDAPASQPPYSGFRWAIAHPTVDAPSLREEAARRVDPLASCIMRCYRTLLLFGIDLLKESKEGSTIMQHYVISPSPPTR